MQFFYSQLSVHAVGVASNTVLHIFHKALGRRLPLRTGRTATVVCTNSNEINYSSFFSFHQNDEVHVELYQRTKYVIKKHKMHLLCKCTTQSNTSASYIDLLLSIRTDGQFHTTSIYDKRDDFNFHITNFTFLSSNIPSSPAYGVFISHFIRYSQACSSYECFILRARHLYSKLLN